MKKRVLVYDGYFKVFLVPTEDGDRERIEATDAINLLLVDYENRRIVLVRQPRVNMIRDDNPDGLITETVAGRFDVNLGPQALAVKEAHEEVGAEITEDRVILVNGGQPMALSAGSITERAYGAIVVLKPGQLEQGEREFGAEGEGEHIRRIYLKFDELDDYVFEDWRVFALVQYFLKMLALGQIGDFIDQKINDR